jgi:hypothetical protein
VGGEQFQIHDAEKELAVKDAELKSLHGSASGPNQVGDFAGNGSGVLLDG